MGTLILVVLVRFVGEKRIPWHMPGIPIKGFNYHSNIHQV